KALQYTGVRSITRQPLRPRTSYCFYYTFSKKSAGDSTMKPAELIAHWNKTTSGELTAHSYAINLPLEDAAKIQALALMYPKRTQEQLITDLLAAALYELEESMPYVKGDQ